MKDEAVLAFQMKKNLDQMNSVIKELEEPENHQAQEECSVIIFCLLVVIIDVMIKVYFRSIVTFLVSPCKPFELPTYSLPVLVQTN